MTEADECDPTAHTADEVTAYLATASADEFARVKAAEAAGKDRKTVADFTQSVENPPEPSEDGYTRVVVS